MSADHVIDAAWISRRTLVAGSAAVLAAVLAGPGGALFAAPASAATPTGRRTFAFLTDSHADPENATNLARLAAVMRAIELDDPELVLHGGDVTEYGSAPEYREHLARVPATLRDKLVHVPGNHEVRWDVTAFATYDAHVKGRNQELMVGGVQFLLLDPTVVQQEFGYYTRADLDWLRARLQGKPAHVPTVIVVHYPMAEGQYYLVNPEEFLAAIQGRNVRLVLSGHTHRAFVDRFNGLAHVEGPANRNAAQYYRIVAEAERLTIEHVTIPDLARPDQQVVTPGAVVELGGATGRSPMDARAVAAEASGGTLAVRLSTRRLPDDVTARASLLHQAVYAGSRANAWVPLERSGNGFAGRLDVSALPPGEHRVNVELVQGEQRWRCIERFTIAGDAFAPVWEHDLGDMVTGGTAVAGGRVFVPSTAGDVTAFEPTASGPGVAWRAATGPVFTTLAASDALRLVVAGSSDGRVTALRVADGSVAWRADMGRPVMSDPLLATIGGQTSVVVMAGDQLSRLDAATGRRRWTVTAPGIFAGRPAADDQRVYLGAGDGKAWALDAATGAWLWSQDLAGRPNSYRKVIYGPWTNHLALITPDLVLASTVSAGRALNRATGAVVWQIAKSYLYTPPTLLDGGDLLLIDEWGEVRRVDAATGTTRWVTPRLVSRSLDAAPVVVGDTAYVPGTMGDLAAVSLSDGSFRVVRQLSVSPIVSSPAVVGGVLVVGHLDGRVRGYRVG